MGTDSMGTDNSTRRLGDWAPSAAWAVVRQRAALLRELRLFFDSQGFVEIETPVLSRETVVDRHLDPIGVPTLGPAGWLQTSPEFGMKRAVARYRESVYQITRAFRRGESGRLHNPEFTILEWYQTPADYQDGMQQLSELASTVFGRGSPERVSYREAFVEHTGLDPHTASITDLSECTYGTRTDEPKGSRPDFGPDFGEDRDGWLDRLLSEQVQPKLGFGQPLILYDYPASQAALAKIDPGPPPVAQRFELYVDGVELANGYHELDDAVEFVKRMAEQNRLRVADGRASLPETSRLVDAMSQGLPPCAGVAVGVDRLLMVKLGLSNIDEVLTFPDDRA